MITPLPQLSKLSILTMAGLTRWMVSAKEGGGVGTGVAAGGIVSAEAGSASNVA